MKRQFSDTDPSPPKRTMQVKKEARLPGLGLGLLGLAARGVETVDGLWQSGSSSLRAVGGEVTCDELKVIRSSTSSFSPTDVRGVIVVNSDLVVNTGVGGVGAQGSSSGGGDRDSLGSQVAQHSDSELSGL